MPEPTAEATGPLKGIRVLDLTGVVLGPFATGMLGDWGAEVIKVEPPNGDLVRNSGVYRNRGMASVFLAINRNKRSLCLDIKAPEDKAMGYTVVTILAAIVVALLIGVLTAPIDGIFGAISSVRWAANRVTLTWASANGKVYRVLYKDDLNEPAWREILGDITAASTTTSYTNSVGFRPKRFYRILEVP